MSATRPAVLVMAEAPAGSDGREGELEALLGAERAGELRAALLAQAVAWGRGLAPDDLHLADPDDRLADAVGRVFASHDGALVIVWPSLPRLRSEHAAATVGDLDAGCDLILGPTLDGGLYLLGLARPLPALFSSTDGAWPGPDAMGLGFALARDEGLEIGLLRAERALQRAADVRAALADPLLPAELAAILRPPRVSGSATA